MTDTGAVSGIEGICENGIVIIKVYIKAGSYGVIRVGKISDTKYIPRILASGYPDCGMAGDDIKSFSSARINIDGEISTWIIKPLQGAESLNFIYPARFPGTSS